MAIITWQNVGQGDFSSGNALTRTGLDMINRAGDTAQSTLGNAIKMNDEQRAVLQDQAQKDWTARLLSAKTPEEVSALQSSGKLGEGISPGLVTQDMLKQVDLRAQDLLGRDRQAQAFDQSKKAWAQDAIDWADKNLSRQEARDYRVQLDAAAPIFDQYAKLAQRDPSAAMAAFQKDAAAKGIKLSLPDMERLNQTYHGLYIAPDHVGIQLRQNHLAAELADQIRALGTGPEAAVKDAALRKKYAPEIGVLADSILGRSDGGYMARRRDVGATQDFRSMPGDTPALQDGRTVNQIIGDSQAAVTRAHARLSPLAQDYAAVQADPKIQNQSVAEAASSLSDLLKSAGKTDQDIPIGEAQQMIRALIDAQPKDQPPMPPAVAARVIARNASPNAWYKNLFTFDSTIGNLSVPDSALDGAAADASTASAAAESYRKDLQGQEAVQRLAGQYRDAGNAYELSTQTYRVHPEQGARVLEDRTQAQRAAAALARATGVPTTSIPGLPPELGGARPAPAPENPAQVSAPSSWPQQVLGILSVQAHQRNAAHAAALRPLRPLNGEEAQAFAEAKRRLANDPNDRLAIQTINRLGGAQ